MKFSEQWLRNWSNPKISTQEMCDQLTMAGLEVDSVEPAAGEFTKVVVARVESLEKHPDADKLNVCQVTDGKETLQIVCGAANVRAGLIIPLAKIGAVLPGATVGESESWEIKPAKLRGVESFGMLCSEKELGLADSADGLMELPADAPIGQDIRDYLQLDDTIIELDLTPNRGDCLSITGIARELCALNHCDMTEPQWAPYKQTINDEFPVEVQAKEACTHYAGRVIKGIDTKAQSPLWLLERLRRSGLRGLSPVVDITNYVMLELGQPMHAFDLQKLDEKINVRFAEPSEKITLLDGKTIELQNTSLVIADNSKVLALAGVMGGEESAVSDTTTDIFLESAFFKPEIIAGKARSYGLHTDSSHRFERGVDIEMQVHAIERATELIREICGGEVGPVTEYLSASHFAEAIPVHLRADRIKRVLGIELTADEVTDIFQRLKMEVKVYPDGWLVKAPSFRFDIQIEADLLEEVVRVYGYNNIPRTCPSYHAVVQEQPEAKNVLNDLKKCLVNRGYFEAISYSFVDPKWQKILDPQAKTIALANPLSSEMSVMRTTLWTGLLNALKHNVNRQQSRVRLFETGLCFRPKNSDPETVDVKNIDQKAMFAGVVCGDIHYEQWSEQARKVDFFDIKADVEALLNFSAETTIFVADDSMLHPALHPGQSASIKQNNEVIGWVGALHPQVQKALDIDPRTYVFEIKQSAIENNSIPAFSALSRFPEVRRDLAVLVDEATPVSEILSIIAESSSDLVKETQLFDIYQGKGVEEGRKSVAFGLILQEFSRTLTDTDVDTEVENIVSALNQQLAATLRE
ncbi:Phenylalanyl-tRNA synthetase beta chain [hydrothermal vent metagenome]|uniref:Phenylalanine--tRNA ligase beta subunit n=1 Tax=hydrothermal vent metagenome TaxID=652676 RepID=A0A3B0W9F2_9ZZZZ